jgi:hypothetical protein
MTLKDVCNEDMKVNFSNTAGPSDLVYTTDPGIDLVKVVPVLSTKCKALNKKVATTSVTITWTVATGGCPYTSATHVFIAGASSIAATAVKTKAENALVLRKGDSGVCAGTWQPPGGPPPPPLPCACDVEISDAGQTKAKAQ